MPHARIPEKTTELLNDDVDCGGGVLWVSTCFGVDQFHREMIIKQETH